MAAAATRIRIDSPTVETRHQGIPPGIQWMRDLVYKHVGARDLKLDIWLPEARPAPVPAIVWICGGGWRAMNRLGVYTVSGWLAGDGYAIVGVEYRCSGEAIFPACIDDLKAAVRYLRANAAVCGIDPDRIGVWGDSAGGHLAELLGVSSGCDALEREGGDRGQSSAVSPVCAFYPPADLAAMDELEIVRQVMGGSAAELPEAYRLASPIHHVGPGSPPHLIAHGTDDEIVPFEQSTQYVAALEGAGVEVTMVELPGVRHDGHVLYGCLQLKEQVREFFRRHLRPGAGEAQPA